MNKTTTDLEALAKNARDANENLAVARKAYKKAQEVESKAYRDLESARLAVGQAEMALMSWVRA